MREQGPEKKDYEPPKLTVLGTVEEVTRGAAGLLSDASLSFKNVGATDIGFSGTPVSDRTLKRSLAPVMPDEVLRLITGL